MFKETDCLGELEIREDVYYGIQTERARNKYAELTMANATVASAILGYVKGTEIAQKAVAENKTVKQIIRELKLFSDAEIDKLFDTLMMTDWKLSGKILANEKL